MGSATREEHDQHPGEDGCRQDEQGPQRISGWSWLGLDDAALLVACGEAGLVLVSFDRATLPWHAGQVLRAGDSHGGLVIVRRTVRSTDYARQAQLLTTFWTAEGHAWDWADRIVYPPRTL